MNFLFTCSYRKITFHLVLNAIFLILLGLLTFSAFYEALSVYFLSDDFLDIGHTLSLSHFWTMGAGGAGGFRPLLAQLWALDFKLWKYESKGWHLTNILLHILCSWVVYWLGLILFSNKSRPTICKDNTHYIAFLSAIIFCLHPIHIHAIVWISGRADLFVTLFYILAISFFIKSCNKNHLNPMLFLALLSFIAALCTKEMAVTLPIMALLWQTLSRKYNAKGKCYTWLFFAPLIFYIPYRYLLLGGVGAHGSEHLSFNLKTWLSNLKQLVSNLLFFHFSLPSFLKIFILILSLSIFFYILRKERKDNKSKLIEPPAIQVIIFCALWIIVTFLPVSNLQIFDHFLYLPSVGFSLLVGFLIDKILSQIRSSVLKRGFLLVIILLYIISCLLIIKNRLQLYLEASRKVKNILHQLVESQPNPPPSGSEFYFLNLPKSFNGVPMFFWIGKAVEVAYHKPGYFAAHLDDYWRVRLDPSKENLFIYEANPNGLILREDLKRQIFEERKNQTRPPEEPVLVQQKPLNIWQVIKMKFFSKK